MSGMNEEEKGQGKLEHPLLGRIYIGPRGENGTIDTSAL
jgi:hypothetical protein